MFFLKLHLQADQPQISSGLSVSRIKGIRWSAIRRCSRVWVGSSASICVGRGPRWVIKNM